MRVGVVGVGLLGGSIGYILKKKKWAETVLGIGRSKDKLKKAIDLKAIDEYMIGFDEKLRDVDLLIMCVPVQLIPRFIKEALPYLKDGVIITDIGSTKGDIIRSIEKVLPATAYFVGGHPMAGSEKTGVEALDPYIFENAVYVLCESKNTNEKALETVAEMARTLSANVHKMNYDLHDLAVAAISHVPHIVASSLVNTVSKLDKDTGQILGLAAGGFRDTTRIASGSPEMWKDICMTNSDKIIDVIEVLENEINKFKTAVQNKDEKKIEKLFEDGKKVRDTLPKKKKGILSAVFEIVLFVPDEPKVIGNLAILLGESEINIKDIEVLHVRENEGGSIRVAFDKDSDSDKAVKVLTQHGYEFKVLE